MVDQLPPRADEPGGDLGAHPPPAPAQQLGHHDRGQQDRERDERDADVDDDTLHPLRDGTGSVVLAGLAVDRLLRTFMSASFCSPAVEGGGMGAGGGTTVPLVSCRRVVCCSAGASLSMKRSVARVRHDPSDDLQLDPGVDVGAGDPAAIRDDRAEDDPRRDADAVGEQRHQGGVLLVVPDHERRVHAAGVVGEPVAVVARVVDLLVLDDAVGVLALGLRCRAIAKTRRMGWDSPSDHCTAWVSRKPAASAAVPTRPDGALWGVRSSLGRTAVNV